MQLPLPTVQASPPFRADAPVADVLAAALSAELAATDIASGGLIPEPSRVRERNHRRLPGQGDFDLAGFVAAGYTRIVSSEVLSGEVRAAPDGPSAADVHRALRDELGTVITRPAPTAARRQRDLEPS